MRMDSQTDRQTDRPNEVNSRFSKFCKRAQILKNMNRLQAGRPMNRGTTPDGNVRLSSVPQRLDWLQAHQASYPVDTLDLLSEEEAIGALI
jgi:hypothetical protein